MRQARAVGAPKFKRAQLKAVKICLPVFEKWILEKDDYILRFFKHSFRDRPKNVIVRTIANNSRNIQCEYKTFLLDILLHTLV